MQPNAHISVLYMQQQFAWLKIACMDKFHAECKKHNTEGTYFSILNIIAYFINKKNHMVK